MPARRSMDKHRLLRFDHSINLTDPLKSMREGKGLGDSENMLGWDHLKFVHNRNLICAF